MRWTEPQRAMLRAMGVRIWQPDAPAAAAGGAETPPVAQERRGAGQADRDRTAATGEAPAAEARQAEAPTSRPVDTLGWPALRETVAGCSACALSRSRRHTVFGVGNERAHWMIVGEAPGEQEDLRGEPFVGPAGRLLDRMLAALGLTRGEASPARQVFIANALKCRPPHNRNPEAGELARCLPFLERQVQLVQPRVIVAMGRFAVNALLASNEPIGRLRGRVHAWHGVPLVVTYHPAYLLRQPADKARAWADLCLAAEVYERNGAA